MKHLKMDYKFWSKLDAWKLKEAAMLLHGIDPHLYRSIRFNVKDIPKSSQNLSHLMLG